jgi:hypothetical protein
MKNPGLHPRDSDHLDASLPHSPSVARRRWATPFVILSKALGSSAKTNVDSFDGHIATSTNFGPPS